MVEMSVRERRARLVRRHHLSAASPARDPQEVATDLVVLHATDPATVYLSVLARCPDATVDDVSRALYDHKTLVRMLAMRRTMFVVPAELVSVVHNAASVGVARRLRQQIVKDLEAGPTDPPLEGDIDAWLCDVEQSTERALRRRGDATANDLASDEPRLRTAQLPTTGKAYDIRRNITTRVLTLMSTEGRIVRNRPRGAWTSRHHTWALGERWWSNGIPDLAEQDAQAALARLWLATFGPGLMTDLQWWTGWTLGATRKAVAALETVEVDLDGHSGLMLADDIEGAVISEPAAALLPALDPTPMGWQQRDWFLGPHREVLFDRSGNIGPTAWWDGRIVGGWAVRADAEVVWRLLEDVGEEAESAVAAEAARLAARLEGTVVVPSFRTPLERELSE